MTSSPRFRSCLRALAGPHARGVGFALAAALLPAACHTTPPHPRTPLLPRDPVVSVSAGEDQEEGGWTFLSRVDRTQRDWAATFVSHDPTDSLELRKSLEGILRGLAEQHRAELLAALRSPSARRRAVAASALGFSRHPEDASILVPLLEDPDPSVVANALLGLWLSGGTFPLEAVLARIESSPDAGVRANAALAIAGIPDLESSPELLATLSLATADEDARVRLHAVRALGRLSGSLAAGPLLRATQDADPVVQAAACLALGRRPSAESAQALSRALESDNPLVRESAARALAEHAQGDATSGSR